MAYSAVIALVASKEERRQAKDASILRWLPSQGNSKLTLTVWCDVDTNALSVEGEPMLAEGYQSSAETGWVSVDEAARFVGVSRQAVHGWIARGQLTAERVDGRYRVEADGLQRIHVLRSAAVTTGIHRKTLARWISE